MFEHLLSILLPWMNELPTNSDGEGMSIGVRIALLMYYDINGRYRKFKRLAKIEGRSDSMLFQIWWRKKPLYRLGYAENRSPSKLHMYFGNMEYNRPWYAPWYKY